MARGTSERIFDILRGAKELNFKLVIGAPAALMNGEDIYRSEPPMVPGKRPQLVFYLSRAAWNKFKVDFCVDQLKFPLLKGVEIEEYDKSPAKEVSNGEG